MNKMIISRPAAGLLMNFSRGCDIVINVMGSSSQTPSSPTNNSCCSDGYHSDSDSEENYTELVQQYRNIYLKNRVETLDALDKLPQLKRGHHLKTKILFSIIVVSVKGTWHSKRIYSFSFVCSILNYYSFSWHSVLVIRYVNVNYPISVEYSQLPTVQMQAMRHQPI